MNQTNKYAALVKDVANQGKDMIKEALDRLLDVGRSTAGLDIKMNPEGEPFGVMPNGNVTKLAEFYPPRVIRQRPTFLEVGSFAAYVNRFKTPDTLIFATVTEDGATFTAILDYHQPSVVAQRCAHVAGFNLVATPDWKSWTEQNREAMPQVEFATWLEDMQHVFTEPAGSDFLELVRNLHGRKDASFNQSFRADNGAFSVRYEEQIDVQSSVKGGTLKLPELLVARMQVFEGLLPATVTARLKVRVQDRRLFLFFETIQIEKIVRDCILASVAEIAEKTSLVPLLGSAN
jgi:uncharacterized protein YfdQ (DUF2303 family)